MPKTKKIGRDAITGEFLSVEDAKAHSKTAIVETVKIGRPKKSKGKK